MYYKDIGRESDFANILDIIKSNKVLNEILPALSSRIKNGDINNAGVLPMVEGYFTELGFVFAELFRVCKSDSSVAFVNDNVRYAGEVIPVDFLSSDLAKAFGFSIKKYTA